MKEFLFNDNKEVLLPLFKLFKSTLLAVNCNLYVCFLQQSNCKLDSWCLWVLDGCLVVASNRNLHLNGCPSFIVETQLLLSIFRKFLLIVEANWWKLNDMKYDLITIEVGASVSNLQEIINTSEKILLCLRLFSCMPLINHKVVESFQKACLLVHLELLISNVKTLVCCQ